MIIGDVAITGIITIITAVSITITIRITGTTTCITEAELDDMTTQLTILIDHTRVVMTAAECTEEEERLTLLMKVFEQEVHLTIDSGVAMCVAGHSHLKQVVEYPILERVRLQADLLVNKESNRRPPEQHRRPPERVRLLVEQLVDSGLNPLQ
jgi:hypothetical protein